MTGAKQDVVVVRRKKEKEGEDGKGMKMEKWAIV
jgi:hypothetical protein